MDIQKELDIFLITYNRKYFLENTLESIFSETSPIKNLDITILDNASTDGTSELIREYLQKFSNIKYIRHNKNIGGNANICRAFELASKKYFWIICDDDKYDWHNWQEIESALNKNYDLVLTQRTVPLDKMDEAELINQLSFLPSGIFKTENLTEDVLQAAYNNISNTFPHLALVCYLFNEKKSYYLPKETVIKQGWNLKTNSTVNMNRGIEKFVYHRFEYPNIFTFYINSFQMLKDKRLRKKCCEKIFTGYHFYFAMLVSFIENKFYIYNISDIFFGISFCQKFVFLFSFLTYIIFILPFKFILGKNFDNLVNKMRNIKRKLENK